ncbi:TPA: sulfite exporter TauE/SafE family protein [Proteus mirabilis]|nr:sulfite exporter TauE/SafE family protein [Proteus mirabilis]
MEMILLFLIVGCITGFFAGLLGIGGGAIIVPIVMYVVSQQAIPADMVMKIALSTSFSVIIFSTASSAYSHNKHKAILWSQFPHLALGTLLGMLVGTFLVQKLSNTLLQIIFCIFMAYTIYGLLTKKKEAERVENAQDPVISQPALTTGGSLVGFISSFIGIAGGTITIPLLSHWGFNTRKCIATSSMLGVIIATIGTVMGIVYGWQQTELANYYLGFIYLPAFIGISITSILTAPIGVKVAYRLPIARVRQIFALFLLIVMIKMLYTLILG